MIDNKDEQFPVVDEMGNILGAIRCMNPSM